MKKKQNSYLDIPSVRGLILIGGKSSRMGTDKSELNYFGKPQREVSKELLENEGIQTFYSVKKGSVNPNSIQDSTENLGPLGGICAAFEFDVSSAWFVLATDLPFVNTTLIKLLLEKRNPQKIATAIKGKNKKYAEPLIAIYEPKSYPVILEYIANCNISPREILEKSDVQIIEVDDNLIRNINTFEEYKSARKEIEIRK